MFVIKTAETLTGWSAADYSHSQRGGGHSLRFLIITMNITEKTLKTLSVKHLIAFKHQGPKFEGKKLSLKYLISQFQYC